MLRHEAFGFAFCPKKGVLRIFIALNYPSPSAWFEYANLGSSGKHANYYTTEATTAPLHKFAICS
jgi:hypothetical protein